jgi:hypothetical protein
MEDDEEEEDSEPSSHDICCIGKAFRAYVRRGIEKDIFPPWLSENNDMGKLVTIAVSHHFRSQHHQEGDSVRNPGMETIMKTKSYSKLHRKCAETFLRSPTMFDSCDWGDYLSDWSDEDNEGGTPKTKHTFLSWGMLCCAVLLLITC